MRALLSGNEAIALGAYHAGVAVATAYPGTPSTEILETLAGCEDVYTEWSVNEKVAMEVALGAVYGGVRALVSMKHVGLNVAADPFFAASVTGVGGGLVVVSADDPGMSSSQNEQDNRHYAKFAKVPMLEPADSQEAYDLMAIAFQMSEDFDTPVLVRTTTRISHCKSVVEAKGQRLPPPSKGFRRDPEKYVMLPSNARRRHPLMEERIGKLADLADTFPYNRMEMGEKRLGIVASGVAYQYAREVFPEASFLKLVMTYPIPRGLIQRFAREVERLLVVEELDPFLEEAIQAMGIPVMGKEFLPMVGELSAEIVREGARRAGLLTGPSLNESKKPERALPARLPVLCPGCPHTALSFALRKLGFYRDVGEPLADTRGRILSPKKRSGIIATSDIGCYTLAAYPPLLALDTCACMGASVGQAQGLERAGLANKVVAVIGDSTFMHSGIAPLVNAVYNQSNLTLIILDNGTTAMTGHQGHPGTGISARGKPGVRVLLEDLARGCGVKDVQVLDAFDLEGIEATLRRCVETDEPSVLIVRGPCPLHIRLKPDPLAVVNDKCDGCSTCIRLGCPAMILDNNKVRIEETLCVGEPCRLCLQVCPQQAIVTRQVKGPVDAKAEN